MKISAILLLAVAAAAWGSGAAHAEGDWLTVGLGAGDARGEADDLLAGDAAMLVAGTSQRGNNLVCLRSSRLGFERAVGDVALVFGRTLTRGGACLSVGVGPSVLYLDAEGGEPRLVLADKAVADVTTSSYFGHAGLAWMVELSRASASTARAGLQVFGALAADGFWGAAAVVAFGPGGR